MSAELTAVVRQVGPSTSEGTARTHTVLVDRPDAKGGADRGPMGGELLLVGLAGCFMSNLLAAIRSRDAPVAEVQVRARANVTGTPPRMSAFTLRVSANHSDPELMRKLLAIAERGCLASNTLREGSEITVLLEEVGPTGPE
jgi:putative redox protein